MSISGESTNVFQSLLKEFLRIAYLLTIRKDTFSAEEFSVELNRTLEEGKALLSVLIGMKFLKRDSILDSDSGFYTPATHRS